MKGLITSLASLFGYQVAKKPKVYQRRKDIFATLPIGGIYSVEPHDHMAMRKLAYYHGKRMGKKFSVRRNPEGRYDLQCVA